MGAGTNKLIETSMAMLQAVPDQQLNIVVLNKALFYADLFALRDLGHTITEQKYVALEMGPVVAAYDRRVVKGLEKSGLAKQLVLGKARPMKVVATLESFPLLTSEEVEIARGIGRSCSKYTSFMLSNFSHENPGWVLARENATRGKPADINMLIALQQLTALDEDPWMDESVDSGLFKHVEHDEDKLVPWQ